MSYMYFKKGDRVVIQQSSKYDNRYVNCVGTIVRISGTNIGVKLDGIPNRNSQYDAHWYSSDDLRYTNSKNDRGEIAMFEKGYTTIGVQFPNNDRVIAYACYIDGLKAGDHIVVNTAHHGIQVGVVSEQLPGRDPEYPREVICKVDMTGFNDRRDRLVRINELQSQMNDRIRQNEKLMMYQMMAEKDPTFRTLFEEYRQLACPEVQLVTDHG